jgi:hypothetical protein
VRVAERIAAATVNKIRRQKGEAKAGRWIILKSVIFGK